MTPSRILAIAITVVLLLVGLVLSTQLVENVDANEIMVVQAPISGNLTWYITPGVKWQGLGKVTIYPRRSSYKFEIPVRFNDGGHGTMHGSIQYDMPLDVKNLTQLHTKYGSPEAIQKQLVETVTNKSVYMTGPLMSSKESYAEKRNYLINFVEDQIAHGVYKTISHETKVKDSMTGSDKTVTVVDIVLGKDGLPERQESAVLAEFGIHPFNFAIEKLPYDQDVDKQIQDQQKLIMEVQTSMAEAKKAEQRTITVTEQGKADAAKAKWDQEVEKAKEVTAAEKRLAVAILEAQAAEETKKKDILLGEGEATRKRLVMNADGGLEPKLAAVIEINKLYADAIKNHPGSWVPTVVMGASGSTGTYPGGGAMPLIELLTAKTARDLGIDLAVSGVKQTKSDK